MNPLCFFLLSIIMASLLASTVLATIIQTFYRQNDESSESGGQISFRKKAMKLLPIVILRNGFLTSIGVWSALVARIGPMFEKTLVSGITIGLLLTFVYTLIYSFISRAKRICLSVLGMLSGLIIGGILGITFTVVIGLYIGEVLDTSVIILIGMLVGGLVGAIQACKLVAIFPQFVLIRMMGNTITLRESIMQISRSFLIFRAD